MLYFVVYLRVMILLGKGFLVLPERSNSSLQRSIKLMPSLKNNIFSFRFVLLRSHKCTICIVGLFTPKL